MSFYALQWAMDAPVANVYERVILGALAYRASDDGTDAYPSKQSIAERAMCDPKTVQRHLHNMVQRGLIALGDQSIAERRYRADKRPVVYDILIPFSWYSDAQREKINEGRAERGLPPLTPQNRPAIAQPPNRAGRSDKGIPRKKTPAITQQDSESPRDRGDSESPGGAGGLTVPNGGTLSPERGDCQYPKQVLNPSGNQSSNSLVGDSATDAESDTSKQDLNEGREDVERLCQHLAERMMANGCRKPTITKKWRDAARLLLDKDGCTEDQVHKAIDWCQNDTFWRSNILSMPTLREKYDQLRLKAMQEQQQQRTGFGGGFRKPTQDEKVLGLLDLARTASENGGLLDFDSDPQLQLTKGGDFQ